MYCVVRHCKSIWQPKSDIKFHSFPKNQERRRSWLSIVPLKALFFENAKICNLHFKESDYDPERPTHLLPSATPFFKPLACGCDATKDCRGARSGCTTQKTTKYLTLNPVSPVKVTAGRSTSPSSTDHTYIQRPFAGTDISVEMAEAYSEQHPKEHVELKQTPVSSYIYPMAQTRPSVSGLNKKVYQKQLQRLRSSLQDRQNQKNVRKQRACRVRTKSSAQHANQGSKGEILACRACLTTEARFASLGDSMMQAFRELSGTPFSTDVDLPQHFCALCRKELSKFVAFRERCQRASELLMTLMEFGALTNDDISSIDRNAYKLTHSLNKLNVYHYNSNEPVFAPLPIKIEKDDVGLEVEDSYSELEFLENEKETLEIDMNDTEDEAEVEYLDDTDDEKDESLENNAISIEDGEQEEAWENLNDTSDKTKKRIKEVFNDDVQQENKTLEEDENFEVNLIEYLEMEFSDDASRDTNILENLNSIMNSVDVDKATILTKRKSRKTKKNKVVVNDYPNFDCAAFEKRYQVKITVLEKEEQLKEIEERKKESSYLNAAYKCEFCGKGFKAETPYKTHMTYHDERVGRWSCEICQFRFPDHMRLRQHRKMHRVRYSCLQCGHVSRGKAFATRHHEIHLGKKYACKHCSRAFTHSTTCYNHARMYHARENIACDQCGETFLSARGVRLHQARAHREKLAAGTEFKCPTCRVKFESSEALDRHKSTASDVKLIQHMLLCPCAACGENCESAAALEDHTALKHPPDQYWCEECDKNFLNAASFDKHTIRKHREPVRRRNNSPRRTKVCCEICGLFVVSEAHLRQHQFTHAADKPFKCPFCQRGFAAKLARDFHIRTHTGERPYQCEQCPLAFALQCNLRRHHNVVHLGQRSNFSCELCGKSFTQRYSVKLHVNTVHNGMPWPKRVRKKRAAKK